MPEKTFKIIELCGVSDNSYAEATKNAVAKASETLRNLDWFEVVSQRGVIKNGMVAEFQVVLKVASGSSPARPPTDTGCRCGISWSLVDRVPDHSRSW
jgi:dodecin